MKIIHVVESFAGGVYDFICYLTTEMANVEHTIIYAERSHTPSNFSRQFPDNVTFIPWKHASREIHLMKDFLALIELVKILKSIKTVDIIHLHSSKAGFLGRCAARWMKLQNKVVYTSHGVSFIRKDVSRLKRNIFIALERLVFFLGGQIIACSESEMQEFHRLGLPAKYINNGIPCNTYRTVHKETNKLCIGTIGRISVPKNPLLFNQIAKHFLDDKSLYFVWVGDGELKQTLSSPNIQITGWVNSEQMGVYLDKMVIYLSTSLWEGLPLSVLSAMCAEKPLVLSECTGNKDLLIHGRNGFFFKNLQGAIQSIETIITENKISSYGSASKDYFLRHFTLGAMVSNYSRLYRNIAK